jgi:hypothetical protein
MSNDTELTNPPSVGTVPMRSAAARRMRVHRKRRRTGLRCVLVQLRETEIDVLRGLLKADARNNVRAIGDAIHAHFDKTLRA